MPWDKWKDDGTGEQIKEKTTEKSDGGSKYESLRSNDGDKKDHQHTYIHTDKDGKIESGGATPGKK